MSNAVSLVVPLLLAGIAIFALKNKVDVFSALVDGAKNGIHTVVSIFPALVVLLTAVYMLRASGVLDAFSELISSAFQKIGIPGACAPLMLLRPVSGSGALSVASELIKTYGADSLIGRTAAVMMGSTETTLYVVAVYFGAAGIRKSRHAIPAALCADLVGFVTAAVLCRKFWG